MKGDVMTIKTRKPITIIKNGNIFRYIPKLSASSKKRITNTRSHRDFSLRQRTTKNGRKGQIKGRYKSPISSKSL